MWTVSPSASEPAPLRTKLSLAGGELSARLHVELVDLLPCGLHEEASVLLH
jgi:hypothetical protein